MSATPALPVRAVPLGAVHGGVDMDAPLEWLVTNGLGGYASGLVAGGVSRRYHGLLIASLPAPLGRTLVLDVLRASLVDGRHEHVIEHEHPDVPTTTLRSFTLEGGLPVWRFDADGVQIEKRVVMPYRHNTTVVVFRLIGAARTVRLHLRPFAAVRSHDARLTPELGASPTVRNSTRPGGRIGVELDASPTLPHVRWLAAGPHCRWHLDDEERVSLTYATERRRGYDCEQTLWSPGWVDVALGPDDAAAFVVTTELWQDVDDIVADAVVKEELARRRALLASAGSPHDAVTAELALAADQFLVVPVSRAEEVARARAIGDESRSVIAGYHWFTDWGRDTMISLEGLTLATGRAREAGCILRTFGRHLRNGLIPNLFPEGAREGLYHTADATLWFFHAIDRYLQATPDRSLLIELLPRLSEVIDHHLAGTSFGIGVDPQDGLLRQGAPALQLTWMDAKCDDWVVTPRRGKAVEINALWYNALCLAAQWLDQEGQPARARRCADAAARVRAAFNARFWNRGRGCLFDVVDGERGDDAACRPNQLFSISLPHPVLEEARWSAVVDVVTEELVTPLGLRTLSPEHPDFRPTYFGDLRTRDAAYHQGTVWAWLIGPFIDAWLRVHPGDHVSARAFLEGLVPHLGQAGTGSISEIFDARAPYAPRGCIAQAWSVAEMLRAWRLTEAGASER